MTREELLYKICPTDTTYDCRNGNKYCNCDDCINEMNVWLEEYDKQIKAETIEEYKNALLKLIKDEQNTRYGYLNEMDIREVADLINKKNIPLIH